MLNLNYLKYKYKTWRCYRKHTNKHYLTITPSTMYSIGFGKERGSYYDLTIIPTEVYFNPKAFTFRGKVRHSYFFI